MWCHFAEEYGTALFPPVVTGTGYDRKSTWSDQVETCFLVLALLPKISFVTLDNSLSGLLLPHWQSQVFPHWQSQVLV